MTDTTGDLGRASRSGLLWTGLATTVQAGLQFLVLAVLARLLDADEFGLVTATLVVVGLGQVFAKLGVGPAVVQREDLTPEHERTGFALGVYTGLVFAAALFFTAPLVAELFRMPDLAPLTRVISVAFIFQGLGVVAEGLAQRRLRFRLLGITEAISFGLGYAVVGITAAIAGAGAWSLVAAYLVQVIVKTVVLLWTVPFPKSLVPHRQAAKDLLWFGSGFTIARLGNYVAGQGDFFVVGRSLGAEALGFYSRAYQLMVMPAVFVGQILDRVLFPVLSRLQHDAERIAQGYRRGLASVSVLTIPISVAAFILADEIVRVVLGPDWEPTIAPFRILSVSLLFRTSYKISDSLTRATGRVYARAWRQGIFAGSVLLGAIIGKQWDISGVAVGVTVAIVLNFLLMGHLSIATTGLTWGAFWRAQVTGVPLGIGVGVIIGIVSAATTAAGFSPLAVLVASLGLAGAAVAAAIWRVPERAVGADGVWLIDQFGEMLGSLKRPARAT